MFTWKHSQFINQHYCRKESDVLCHSEPTPCRTAATEQKGKKSCFQQMASSWWAFLYLILSTSESCSSTSWTMAVSMLRLRTGLALWANNDKHGQRYIYFFLFLLFILLVNAFVSWPLHGVFVGSRHHRTTFLVVRSHHGCRVHGFSCLQLPPVAVVWSKFVSKQTQYPS